MANTNLKKNAKGYGYMYTDLAQIHEYLEQEGMRYIQSVERIDGDDYVLTKRFVDGKWEDGWIRGCRVVQATLKGVNNPAQEQGSALTYARRYSVLMAFGLATTDDDAHTLTTPKEDKKPVTKSEKEGLVASCQAKGVVVTDLLKEVGWNEGEILTREQYGKAMNKLTQVK